MELTRINGLVPPMLAMKYDGREAIFPCLVQPKLDGIRCMASCGRDRSVVLHSRGGDLLRIPHIESDLARMMAPGEVWDGELYVHGSSFDDIKRMVKGGDDRLELHVFDEVDYRPFRERHGGLGKRISGESIKLVPVFRADSVCDVETLHEQHVCAGYEGLILRRPEARYYHARSYALMKLKRWDDGEFEVTGYRLAGDGSVVFSCRTEDGKEFSARLSDSRKACVDVDAGAVLTVRHLGWTCNGLPRQPFAVRIRPAYDLQAA